jgi:hypothetical protein
MKLGEERILAFTTLLQMTTVRRITHSVLGTWNRKWVVKILCTAAALSSYRNAEQRAMQKVSVIFKPSTFCRAPQLS